jgi:hypothetical protein
MLYKNVFYHGPNGPRNKYRIAECIVRGPNNQPHQKQPLSTWNIAWTGHHLPQYAATGILPNATGQQWVQQVQLTFAQSVTKISNDRSELQNGIVSTN